MTASDSGAFISYSRNDAEFAMRLASELKAAGADVWLDQLDIAPGQRWDRAVEKALNDSPVMLVVLSPAAIDSTNVMDEVSYALDERKTVIPLVVQDCAIPFRLRRIQHVDFRTNHGRGLEALLKHLGVRGLQGSAPEYAAGEAARPRIGRYEIVAQIGGAKIDETPRLELSGIGTPKAPERAAELTPRTQVSSGNWSYEIVSVLGRGGSGVVYLAKDLISGRESALKLLSKIGPKLRERYLSEMQPRVMVHPNIAKLYDVGVHAGDAFIVMELVRGTLLDHILKGDKVLRLTEKLGIARQVCDGLAYAHRCGMVHQDIRPANIMVQPDGLVKILNFEMLRGASPTSVVGTFPYISPERMKRQPPTERSDIWSVGVLLYLMLAGNLPFSGQGVFDELKAVTEPYRPLSKILQDYPSAIDAVMKRALATNPDQRYASADEMGFDIQSMIDALKKRAIQ